MRKILVFNITGINNWGDDILSECAEYVLKTDKDNMVVTQTMEPDMLPLIKMLYYPLMAVYKMAPRSSIGCHAGILAVRTRCFNIYSSHIKACDGVVVECGSLKYGTQRFWIYYSLVTDIAQKYNVPVMFNAMNIQSFNQHDPRCIYLKKHISSSCVKMITSRDGEAGVKKLREDYKLPETVICEGVGDMGFWIPETYDVYKKNDRMVGINLIDGGVFTRYGGKLTEDEQLDIYLSLLRGLDAVGIKWSLFTNGLPRDKKFGEKLLALYGDSSLEIASAGSASEYIEMVSGFGSIVGARLHACITAYTLGIPFVGFAWDEKLMSFAKMAKIEELFLDEQTLLKNHNSLRDKFLSVYRAGFEYDRANLEYWRNRTQKCLIEFCESI